MDGKLKLQKTIYEHSYSKLHRCFFKRAPAILAKYEAIMRSLQADEEDTDLLVVTHWLLEHIQSQLKNERPPLDLTDLVQMIDEMSVGWQDHLKAVGVEDILTHWDDSIYTSGLTFHIYETIAHLLLFRCWPEQGIVSATVISKPWAIYGTL
jgi:hypothetical protein